VYKRQDFLHAIKRQSAALPVVVMTAFGTVETAVDEMCIRDRYWAEARGNPIVNAAAQHNLQRSSCLLYTSRCV